MGSDIHLDASRRGNEGRSSSASSSQQSLQAINSVLFCIAMESYVELASVYVCDSTSLAV